MSGKEGSGALPGGRNAHLGDEDERAAVQAAQAADEHLALEDDGNGALACPDVMGEGEGKG